MTGSHVSNVDFDQNSAPKEPVRYWREKLEVKGVHSPLVWVVVVLALVEKRAYSILQGKQIGDCVDGRVRLVLYLAMEGFFKSRVARYGIDAVAAHVNVPHALAGAGVFLLTALVHTIHCPCICLLFFSVRRMITRQQRNSVFIKK